MSFKRHACYDIYDMGDKTKSIAENAYIIFYDYAKDLAHNSRH
jgi:hypothetical protein